MLASTYSQGDRWATHGLEEPQLSWIDVHEILLVSPALLIFQFGSGDKRRASGFEAFRVMSIPKELRLYSLN